jgi:hypothetical protein
MIFILIGVSAASGLAALSKAEQPPQYLQAEQATLEALDLLNKKKEMKNEYVEVIDEGEQKVLRYANGRWYLSKNIQEMIDWLEFKLQKLPERKK